MWTVDGMCTAQLSGMCELAMVKLSGLYCNVRQAAEYGTIHTQVF